MLTEVPITWKQYACSWLTRLNIQKISSFLEEIMSLLRSIACMAFMMSVKEDILSSFGRFLQSVSIACQFVQWSRTKSSACMEDYHLISLSLNRLRLSSGQLMYQIKAYSATCFGVTPIKMSQAGEKTREESHMSLVTMLLRHF